MLVKSPDPEEVRWIDHIWRPLYCSQHMKPRQWSSLTDQQIMESQYCLDRYSVRDAHDPT